MLWQLTFSYFYNSGSQHFDEGSQIQTYDFVKEPHKKFTTSQLTNFLKLY